MGKFKFYEEDGSVEELSTSDVTDLADPEQTPEPREFRDLVDFRPSHRPTRFVPRDYFLAHPVFRREEFVAAHRLYGATQAASDSILKYHVGQRHLHVLRRGVYMVSERTAFSPWAAACKLAPDATLAYLGAATFHRLLFLENSIQILSAQRIPAIRYGHIDISSVRAPHPREEAGVEFLHHGYQPIHTTTRERSLVDLLDRPELCPDLMELGRAFRRAGTLDTVAMLRRAHTLGNRTTCARLGFTLELLGLGDRATLEELWRLRPKTPAYFCRATRHHDTPWFIRRWNLVVPRDFQLGLEGRGRTQ